MADARHAHLGVPHRRRVVAIDRTEVALAIDELIKIIPAPDFPTAGLIYGLAGVQEGYRTGRGRVIMRARTHFEDIGNGDPQAY